MTEADRPHLSRTLWAKGLKRAFDLFASLSGLVLASVQNLCLYAHLMRQARKAILEGRFSPWKNEVLQKISRRL